MALYRWCRRPTKHFGETWVPLAFVELQRSDHQFQALALQIDSGAVVSLVRQSVADLLGIDRESGRQIALGSVGGARTTAYLHDVTVRFGGSLVVKAPFAFADTEEVPNLLGRVGVFDELQIDFDASTHETKISPPWLEEGDERLWRFMLETGTHIQKRWDQLKLDRPAHRAVVHLYNKASALVASVAGLVKLHRAKEAPILMRALFEVAAQFEYLLQDPEAHGPKFLDFAPVTKYRQSIAIVQHPDGPISEGIAESPLRLEGGEERLRADYDRVRGQFVDNRGKLWSNWYCMTVRDLARHLGWEGEYRLWYRSFSNWVHSDPSQADHPGFDGSAMLVYCYHYYGRMLLRIAEFGEIVLTNEQYQTLKRFEQRFS